MDFGSLGYLLRLWMLVQEELALRELQLGKAYRESQEQAALTQCLLSPVGGSILEALRKFQDENAVQG